MSVVPDQLLFSLAGIAASLLGFFMVGVFFYVQRGLFPQAEEEARSFLKAVTSSVMLLYGAVVVVSLALVSMTEGQVAAIYGLFALLLVVAVIQVDRATRRLHEVLAVGVTSLVLVWAATLILVAGPWVVGGGIPGRTVLASFIGLALVFAFSSSASLVLSTLDISILESRADGSAPRQEDLSLSPRPSEVEPGG